ncbi:MAG: ATP-binding cassette domain-containing protein [Candidatus Nanopelagicales bacterium]
MNNAIEVAGLVKHFGEVKALDGVDFTVPTGTVVGLLGPNGAGKTTAVRVLTTLLHPTAGRATVVGHDVVAQADQVRKVIGLSGQYAAVDEILTGRENLEMVAGLYHMSRADQRQRANDLLERFDLLDAADRPAKTYSGGMRRRLDLAGALVARPQVMVLDEPTTGLDPRSRIGMWDVIRELVAEGATLLLTTQYLEEADLLTNSIVVIDHGRVIARGTSDELKAQVGGERVEVVITDRGQLANAAAVMRRVAGADAEVNPDDRRVTVPTSASGGAAALVDVVRELDTAAVGIDDIMLRRPTLDDVFLSLTGHVAEDETSPAMAGPKER